MRLFPHEVAIGILGDEFKEGIIPDPRSAFDSKEDALEFLRNLTQEDFGNDCVRWRAWFSTCPQEELDIYYDEWYRRQLITHREARVKWAETRWHDVTQRRCPNCNGLCPEYRNRCWVCEHTIGRMTTE